jgi:lipoprotein-anchoring transpeptidase ErfK/SrfK
MRVNGHRACIAAGRLEPIKGRPLNSCWRIAVLTAAGAIGAASQAQAAVYYYPDSESGFSRPAPTMAQPRPKTRQSAKKIAVPAKESSKPQGPLILAISIQKQKLSIYDANGLFAETPISTGMAGHPTPMGVFSVIQKQKLHHSNIYSGAPMPYMQRITWSGIAIHAGVLPGYPASHGCIRMPMAFAIKMWGWTKMGARVVITPGDMTPASFSHPLLAAQKVMPQPVAADVTIEPAIPKPEIPKPEFSKPDISEANPEPRPSVGHDDGVRPVTGAADASTPVREQTRTADASSTLPTTKDSITMSDAAPTAKAKSDIKLAENAVTATGDTKAGEAQAPTVSETATTEADTPKSTEPKSTEKSTADGNVKAAAPTSVLDVNKEQALLPDAGKPAIAKPDLALPTAPKHSGQISVFISRKDSKLYVRQNFAALFDAPIVIAPSDRPLGTHVFTAQVDKDDANMLHWSVVSLPAPARNAERHNEDGRAVRSRKAAGAVAVKPAPVPDSPAEALDRLTIPADTMSRIAEALSTGSSIIVSDQGIAAGETGEGTDFIVSLR